MSRFSYKFVLPLALGCLLSAAFGQDSDPRPANVSQSDTQLTAAPPPAPDVKPVPLLTGYAAFVPIWDGGKPTLISIISPVVEIPLTARLNFEARAAFEGDFQRRNGNSGDFTGSIDKSLDYLQLDYTASRYATITAGRFLTPFGIFNERLYPNWIRDTQSDPLTFPIGTGSDNGVMARGGIELNRSVTLNYAAYFSALSNADHFESERHAGTRIGVFLPKQRLEVGFSFQHQLQDDRLNRSGLHLQWQPRKLPLDVRFESTFSHVEGNGFWLEGAYRLRDARLEALRKLQLVARTQYFHTGTAIIDGLPDVNTKRTEFGMNYYLTDGWKAIASVGRTFSSDGDANIWTLGMTYRFIIPMGSPR